MTARRGLFWPVLLIAIGLVFLLANFGLIGSVSLVALLGLWPLILILIGLDIAIGRRWPLAALAVDVVVIAGGLALVAAQPTLAPDFLFFGTGNGDSVIDAPRGSAKSMTLHLSGGAAAFTVHGGPLTSSLVIAQSDHSDLHLRSDIRTADRADLRIDQGINGFRFGPPAGTHVDATIANDVNTSIQLDMGAGEFVLDLSDVKLTDARVNVGAASLRLTLPKPSGDVAVTISAGASSVIIEVPAGVEARVTTSGGLSSSRFEGSRFSGGETSGYASAKDRVTVRVSAGASSVVVR